MLCSWKSVILLLLIFIPIQFTAIQIFTSKPFSLWPLPTYRHVGSGALETHGTAGGIHKLHILVLGTARSGSSFVGQLFNQHPNIFYLYEPLHHVYAKLIPKLSFTPAERRVTLSASQDLLRSLYGCDLYILENYIKPTPTYHITDKLFRRAASRALCQQPVCDAFVGDANVEESNCVQKCGALNLTVATDVCRQYNHVAIKVIGVPEIGDVHTLVEDPRLNIKVIQLVRDPRGILSSRIDTFKNQYDQWHVWKSTGKRPNNLNMTQLTVICDDFFGSVSTAFRHPDWLKGKYMLVRHEDLARNPLIKAREIYDFLGLPMDENVTNWILANTKGAKESDIKQQYGTRRNSADTVDGWRLNLPYDIVKHIQVVCEKVFDQLGYEAVQSEEELKNMSISLVQDKTFKPFF